MRRPFTRIEALNRGISDEKLKWAVKAGQVQRLYRGVYLAGGLPPSAIEKALALATAIDGVASHSLAGRLYKLDSVELATRVVTVRRPTRLEPKRVVVRNLDVAHISNVKNFRCTDGLQTLVDLAHELDDVKWEHAMECALYKQLVTIDKLESVADVRGSQLIRRVMALRPPRALPTESLLETLAVQLVRNCVELPTPKRQVVVLNRSDRFVARVDLAWPEYGIFLEPDGGQHKHQPVYDAIRQTAVVAATGWLPGRFTWTEITRHPNATTRRLLELFDQRMSLKRPA